MTYSFSCPIPCNHDILIDAENDNDATIRFIMEGAFRCRNAKYHCHCEKAQHRFPPMSEEQLKKIVKTCLREEE